MGVDEVLGPGEGGGALSGGEVTAGEAVSQFLKVQDVIPVGTGRNEKVDVQVMNDQTGVSVLDLDHIDVPPTFDGAFEHDCSSQLNALVEE